MPIHPVVFSCTGHEIFHDWHPPRQPGSEVLEGGCVCVSATGVDNNLPSAHKRPHLLLSVDDVAVVCGAILQTKLNVKAIPIPVEGANGDGVVCYLLNLCLQTLFTLPQVDNREFGWCILYCVGCCSCGKCMAHKSCSNPGVAHTSTTAAAACTWSVDRLQDWRTTRKQGDERGDNVVVRTPGA